MTAVDNFDELVAFVKDHTVASGTKPSVASGKSIFGSADSLLADLKISAGYEPVSGVFKGNKTGKIGELQGLLGRNEYLGDIVSELGGKSGGLEKAIAKNKDKVTKNFGRVISDLDRIDTQATRALDKVVSSVGRQHEQLLKAFDRESEVIGRELAAATDDAGRKAAQTKLTGLKERYDGAFALVEEASEPQIRHLKDMKDDLGKLVGDLEKETGLKAAEFRTGTSHVAKITGKEGAALGKEAGGLKAFIMKNPIGTAIGAAVVGALAMNLMSGSSKESSRA